MTIGDGVWAQTQRERVRIWAIKALSPLVKSESAFGAVMKHLIDSLPDFDARQRVLAPWVEFEF